MSPLTASCSTKNQLERAHCRKTFFSLILLSYLLLLIMFACGNAYGSEVTLAWDTSTDPAVQGYNLYWRTEGQQYALLDDVGNSVSETISTLQAGTTYYFVATAYDSVRNESEYSNEVKYTVPAAVTTYTLTTSKSGTGTGAIEVNPGGTTFTAGTVVSLTAIPGPNSTFGGWSGICSGTSSTCYLTMNSDINVGATFNVTAAATDTTSSGTATGSQSGTTSSPASAYSLTVTTSGNGSGTVATRPGGTSFKPGKVVTLTAKPSANSGFAGWTGACSGTNKTCKVRMTSNMTVGAEFASYSLIVTTSGNGLGTVTTRPGGTRFKAGATVTITAKPSRSSIFMGWTGACSGTNKTCKVRMDADNKTVEGIFALKTYTISASAGANGTISPSGSLSVLAGTSQAFTATPAEGYRLNYLLVNGRKLKVSSTAYTFSNITKNQRIFAAFINQ